MAAELGDGQEGFAVPTPRRAFGADLATLRTAALVTVVAVTAEVRKSDVIQRPEQLDADAFPRLLMFDAQFFRRLDLPGAFETDILTVLPQEVEHEQLAQAVTGRAVRHAQKGALASAPETGGLIHWNEEGDSPYEN